MAAQKNGFKRSDEDLARYGKAFSAPAKIAILKTLAERNSCICGEIVEVTPLAQSTVSQHLKELKELGLIQGTIEGAKSCYCINSSGLARFRKLFESFLDELDNCPPSCGKKAE